ncbi:MAG TPA: saccharopine dehydrogenase NADP-binding domain-containing protein [Solirubrobacteraceae bacterium]|nr:saccharopine dehydrogenase NADP-binding domain-containing protein [Solirubrobacteraceae bacterium]
MAEHDVVLFGATGFTGGLVAEHLARRANSDSGAGGTPTKWAIAGRNVASLEATRERLAAIDPGLAGMALLQADVGDPESLKRLAQSTRVLATTVGPYFKYGEGLVAACAASGVDYVDITGEPEFVDTMWVRHHELAERTGARIVHSCGFDSIPHDLGTLFTVDRLPEGEPLTVEEFLQAGARISGGTYHTVIQGLSRARATMTAATQRRRLEPRPTGRRARAIRTPLRPNPVGEGWALTAPTIDVDTVLRSARGLDRYGPDFRYGLSFVTRRAATAAGIAGGVGALAVLAQVPPVRNALLRFQDPGDGPDEARRERSWFTARFAGRVGDESVPRVICEVRGGDPGYGETAKMLAESALCLAHDELPEARGMVTPAVAMGQALIDRLTQVGIVFEQVSGE